MSDAITAGLITGGASLLGGLINTGSQLATNAQNERLMREGWLREDNAVQRRVADLKAAGLSPVLAAGSAAQAGAPIRLAAPTTNIGEATGTGVDTATNLMRMKAEIARTNADTERINSQTNQTNTQNALTLSMWDSLVSLQKSLAEKEGKMVGNVQADTNLKVAETAVKREEKGRVQAEAKLTGEKARAEEYENKYWLDKLDIPRSAAESKSAKMAAVLDSIVRELEGKRKQNGSVFTGERPVPSAQGLTEEQELRRRGYKWDPRKREWVR